jgi:hypothetical protein
MSKEEAKEGNVYVVEPIEISSESDPSELEDMDDLDEIKADALDIDELDKLIETTKASKLATQHRERTHHPRRAHAKDHGGKGCETVGGHRRFHTQLPH